MLELVMKCEVCLERLEEYLDGELARVEHEQVAAHLITCVGCSGEFATLTAEQQMFASYDREIEVPPFLWTRIAEHSVVLEESDRLSWSKRFVALFTNRSVSFAGAIAILLLAITVGAFYLISRKPATSEKSFAGSKEQGPNKSTTDDKQPQQVREPERSRRVIADNAKPKPRPKIKAARLDQSDVLSSDPGYLDIDEQETAMHIEQTQNLLRSIRNVPLSGDEEIDVTYDKALSRRLLNENVVLRREAEMKAKFPTKTLLADLEPFLIDIANLPDHARPEEVRAIKERVQKTEIVAALLGFQDRGTNNR